MKPLQHFEMSLAVRTTPRLTPSVTLYGVNDQVLLDTWFKNFYLFDCLDFFVASATGSFALFCRYVNQSTVYEFKQKVGGGMTRIM